jgi:hypothetical protein
MRSQIRLPSPTAPTAMLAVALAVASLPRPAQAQDVFADREILDPGRPEAWAMNYFTATSFMTAFGRTPALEPWQWDLALELGHIPSLSESQRSVGFNGFKNEDLNKTPVFGRARFSLGLPGRWVAELGYTPSVPINGLQAHGLFAAAFGRRWIEREHFTLSSRVFGQHGSATGDITCPEELAGNPDPIANPYGCEAPSHDKVRLHYYGLDLTPSWSRGKLTWHATGALVRTEPEVQVDALTFGFRDRSQLLLRDVVPYFALGFNVEFHEGWYAGAELLHVPLSLHREEGASTEHDPLTSLRVRMGYRARPAMRD